MQLNKKETTFKVLRVLMALSLLSGTIGLDLIGARPAYSEPLNLPAINQFVPLSDTYSFPVLKGLRFDPANPLTLEFIVDTADQKDVSQEEASSLIKYFLAALTIPEEEIWVNLSPYEQDRVIPENLGQTDLGKGLLSQDYVLKQLTSSLTYPESDTGKDYWERTYAEVLKIAKTTNLPVSTFNKIWIVPDKAQVYENENIAVIAEASLKVMLEEDYLALKNKSADILKEKKNLDNQTIEKINKAASEVMKETILPQINRDINSGKNFAALRQIYHSLILGIWFKKKFQDSLYAHYINKGMIKGIDLEDKAVKDKIYSHYVEAFKAGLYNYVKTDYDPASRKNLKRRYYSGGFSLLNESGFLNLEIITKPLSYIASLFRINTEGQAKSLVVKLEGSAASPISAKGKGEEKTFKNAVKQGRETVFVVSSSDADAETMEEFIKGLSRRIAENPLLRDSGSKAEAIAAFPHSDNLQLIKEFSDKLKSAGVSSELARPAVHYAPGNEKKENVGEFFRKLKDLGVEYIIFDSRGQPANDKSLNSAVLRAIENHIKPIIVVGEKDATSYATKVAADQLKVITQGVSAEGIKDMVIVYRPLGLKSFDVGQIVLRHIRELIFQWYGYDAASRIRILYGGENDISSVVNRKSDIDGVFSAKASWMHGLYSGYQIMEFLQRRLEGSSSSPVVPGGAKTQEAEKPASAASPLSKEEADKEKSFRNAEMKKRKNIIVADFSSTVSIPSEKNLRSFMKSILSETKKILEAERSLSGIVKDINVVIAVPLLYIKAAQDVLKKAAGIPSGLVQVAAQDISAAIYSGAVSWRQLKSLGLKYVIVRQPNLSDVDNRSAYGMVEQALAHDINPVIVVGERHDQRYKTAKVAENLVRRSLGMDHALGHGLGFHSLDKIKNIIIVYQGSDYIDPDTVNKVQRDIRRLIFEEYGEAVAGGVRILHGAPRSPQGVSFSYIEHRHLEQPNVDGMFYDNSHVFHIPGTLRNVARKLSNISSSGPVVPGGAEAQEAEKPASAASPLRTGDTGGERPFRRAGKSGRKPIIAGRLFGGEVTIEGAVQLINEMLNQRIGSGKLALKELNPDNLELVVFADISLAHLQAIRDALKASDIPAGLVSLAAQDMPDFGRRHLDNLKALGVEYVIIAGSEYKAQERIRKVFGAGMKPIIIVGETRTERFNNTARPAVLNQIHKILLSNISKDRLKDVVIAYHPPVTISPAEAAWMQLSIRELIRREFGNAIAGAIRILFSGDVSMSDPGLKNLLKADGTLTDNRITPEGGMHIVNIAEKFLEDRKGVSSSPLAAGGEAQAEKPSASAASTISAEGEGEERSFANAVKQNREIVIIENWSMDALSEEQARQLIKGILHDIAKNPHFNKLDPKDMDIIITVAPSFVHLRAVADEINSSTIPKGLVRLAAQDVSAYEKGRTGEVSAAQLKDAGVEYVIIDARNERAEDKIELALKYDIKPIIVVGETDKQREDRAIVSQIISEQLDNILTRAPAIEDMVIVYQPSESLIPEHAENVQEYIRMLIFQRYGDEAASKIPILYGGGEGYRMGRVDLMPNIDGVFINDAAWMSRGFSVSRIGVNFLISKRINAGKGGKASSPLAADGAEVKENSIAVQPWRKGGIDMQGIDVGDSTGSSAPLFDSGFDLRDFSGFTFKIVAINEIDDFDSLVSQPRKQEKKLTSIGSPSA